MDQKNKFTLISSITTPDSKFIPTYNISYFNGRGMILYLLKDKIEIGHMGLSFRGNHIYVENMSNLKEDENWKGIGRAMHEIAIRYSYQSDYDGNVKVTPAYGSTLFHYACGFRYNPNRERIYKSILYGSAPNQAYTSLKEKNFKIENNDDQFDYKMASETAKKINQLKTEPTIEQIRETFNETINIHDQLESMLLSGKKYDQRYLEIYDIGEMYLSDQKRLEWRTIIDGENEI